VHSKRKMPPDQTCPGSYGGRYLLHLGVDGSVQRVEMDPFIRLEASESNEVERLTGSFWDVQEHQATVISNGHRWKTC
jgi:hypothetical protein